MHWHLSVVHICNSQKCCPVVTNVSLQLCSPIKPMPSPIAHGPWPAGGYDSEVSFGGYHHRNNRTCPGPARLAICLGRASAALGRAGQGGLRCRPACSSPVPLFAFSGAATRNLSPRLVQLRCLACASMGLALRPPNRCCTIITVQDSTMAFIPIYSTV
jgi:hypothetical protein